MIYDNLIYKESIKKIANDLPISKGKILVTGASGLIGSCLIDVFQTANNIFNCSFKIYALSRNSERLKMRFGNMDSVRCISQDITEPICIEGLDYIIHAASNADPKSYALYPVETILTNVLGGRSVLEYCKNNKHTRVLLTSTFEVYGKLNQDEYSETDYGNVDINQLRASYTESKRTAEILFKAYCDEYGVDCVIVRLSSIYGPTMLANDSKAHAQFLKNALDGKKIVIKSEGKQKRTYCYVMDAVSGLLTVLFKGEKGETYNVANDKSVATISEVAHTIANLVGTKVTFDLPDEIERKGFSRPQNCVLVTEKIKALGWDGKYDLVSGMKETIEILREM